jgi:hypothetical protein
MIDEILKYNKKFVESKEYEKFETSKYPDKKIAILTCMDTRLVELLPAALGIKNGDIKLIKNAGGMVSSPFGSAVRLAQLMRTCGIYIGAQEDNSILLNPLMLTSRQVGIVCEALKQSMREMKREENKNGCN